MQDRKSHPSKGGTNAKADRLAEALRANLGKRKALARAKKAKAAENPDDAFEMPQEAGRDDETPTPPRDGATRPLRSRTASD